MLIQGPDELAQNQLTLRDLESREQQLLSVDAAAILAAMRR